MSKFLLIIPFIVSVLSACARNPPTFEAKSNYPSSPSSADEISEDQAVGVWDATTRLGFTTYKYRVRIEPTHENSLNYHLRIILEDPMGLRAIGYKKNEIVGYVYISKPNETYEAIGKYKGLFGLTTAWKTIEVTVENKNEIRTYTSNFPMFFLSFRTTYIRKAPSIVKKRPDPVPRSGPQPSVKGDVSGTGFVVNETGHVVTADHVVEECQQIKIRTVTGEIVSAVIIAEDKSNDMAVLNVDSNWPVVATFRGAGEVRQGDDIFVYGFPFIGILASEGNFTDGKVTARAGLGNDTRYLQISAEVQGGNSGGPVLDSHGNVVGLVLSKTGLRFARYTGEIPQNVNFALKASLVEDFLTNNAIGYKIEGSISPVNPADVASRAKQFTVVVICRN